MFGISYAIHFCRGCEHELSIPYGVYFEKHIFFSQTFFFAMRPFLHFDVVLLWYFPQTSIFLIDDIASSTFVWDHAFHFFTQPKSKRSWLRLLLPIFELSRLTFRIFVTKFLTILVIFRKSWMFFFIVVTFFRPSLLLSRPNWDIPRFFFHYNS